MGLSTKIPPPLVVVIVGALMWGIAEATGTSQLPPWLQREVAIGIAAAGLLVLIAGVVSFWRARTTVNPMQPHQASSLVMSGIYRRTRNPMYLGDALLLLAWGLYLGSPAAALIGLPAFVLYIDRFQIAAEERALAAAFGPHYSAYRSKVRRWL